ncbi:MAG: hypothetical protein HOQ05_02965 [Corynebacteriales bacterium]|nr:hypothetical protein [Mycobacteriales bacterium]
MQWWEENKRQTARIALAIAMVVGVDIVARLILRLAMPDSQDDIIPGLIVDACIATTIGVWAFFRARRALVSTVAGEGFFVIAISMLLIAFIGPWVSGDGFGAPIGVMAGRCAVAALVLAVGGALGILTAVAFGIDPLSKAYHAHVERTRQRPRRR